MFHPRLPQACVMHFHVASNKEPLKLNPYFVKVHRLKKQRAKLFFRATGKCKFEFKYRGL